MKKRLLVAGLGVLAAISLGMTASAETLKASDMENYAGHPGMTVTQANDGIHVKLDAADDGTWTTRWGYNYDQVMDGLTITLKNVTMDVAHESGICIAIGNYEGAYDCDRSLMFILNSSKDDNSWVFARTGSPDNGFVNMAGTSITGLSKGKNLTFQWEKKNASTWIWRVNNDEFEFSNDVVSKFIDDEEFVFVTFGGWGFTPTVEYTITSIGVKDTAQPAQTTTQPPQTQKPTSSPSTTTKAQPAGNDNTSTATTKSSDDSSDTADPAETESSADDNVGDSTALPANGTTTAPDEDGNQTGGSPIVWIIIGAVVVLAAACALVYLFVIKPKKNGEPPAQQ